MSKHYLHEPIFFTPPPVRGKYVNGLHKGGSDAPAPDPQIGASSLKSAQVGEKALDFYIAKYNESLPQQQKLSEISAQVQQQLLDSGKLNNAYAKDYYDYMTTTFRPLEKDIVDTANNYDTEGRREAEAGKGLADVRQAFDNQRDMAQRNNERMGVNPNSGNAQALNQELDVQEAIAGANAANTGRQKAEQMGMALKMDAASLGRNLPSNQANSQNIANSSATSAVNVGLSDAQNQRAGVAVGGQGYSTAMQGYANQANILNNDYQNRVGAWNAQNANNNAGMAGLGSLAGVALGMFKDGGEFDESPEVHEGAGEVIGEGTETSDSINAKLSDGEFVQNAGVKKMTKAEIVKAAKSAKAKTGLSALKAINKAGLEKRGA